jgi:hypothetical protein
MKHIHHYDVPAAQSAGDDNITDEMVAAYLEAQGAKVQEVDDMWGRGGRAPEYLHPVEEACRAGLKAAIAVAQTSLDSVPDSLGLYHDRPHTDVGHYRAAKTARNSATTNGVLADAYLLQIDRDEELIQRAHLLCLWIGETPHIRGSINGLAAQLGRVLRERLK